MRVALLVCDHVREALVAEHGDYPLMFRRLLPELAIDDWYVCDGQFPDLNAYDAFVCTGSKYSVYDEVQWIKDLAQFTRQVYEAGKKFIGICFGHQMIAHALGGKVSPSDQGYLIGVHRFDVAGQLPWAKGPVRSYKVLMLCQDQVMLLPPAAQVWAGSPACPTGMFTVGTIFLGIQGHPEFTREYNQAVFESRPEKISPQKMEQARGSFADAPDAALLSGLIRDFLSK